MYKILQKGIILSGFALLLLTAGTTIANAQTIPVTKALKTVTKTFGTHFVYEKSLLEGKETKYDITHLKGRQVEAVLKGILYPEGLVFLYVKENYYTIIPREQLRESMMGAPRIVKPIGTSIISENKTHSSSPITSNNQSLTSTITLQGRVTDAKGYPVPAASVVIPGTPLGVMTDLKGKYSLSNVPENADVVISCIGYIQQRVNINGRTEINIVLKEAVNNLDETVIIGYGKTSKRLNTGSVTTINANIIDKQPVQNIMDALPGRVAGMVITQNNGLPGSNTQIQIRGQSSLNSGTIPLYVIDGVPYTFFNGGQPPQDNLDAWGISGANGGTSPFSSINPDDIESITVLKDADATAIYGARGANGVILITTKKGSAGKSKVDINIYSGIGQVGHWIPMLNTPQYLALRKEAYKNDGIDPSNAVPPPMDLLNWSQSAYTNWQKYLLGHTAHSSNADISYSGDNATTQYRLSGSFRHDGTVFPGNWGDNRATTRFRLSHQSINNKFGFSFSAGYGYEDTKLPSSDISSSYTLPPNYPSKLRDGTGMLIWYRGFTNPLSYLEKPYSGITKNIMGNFSIHYTILPGLDLKLNSGYTNILLDSKSLQPASSKNPSYNPVSIAFFSTDNAENWILEPTVNYNLQTGKGRLTALIGGTFQQNISRTNSIRGTNYTSDLLLGSLVGAGLITSYFPNYSQYNFASLYGRANYNWDDKYIIDATFRRDGSSRFGTNNRFGNFGALGGAWVFSDEHFVKSSLPFLSFGKLRASYGLTGNDQIPNYIYLPLYSLIGTPYQNETGMYEATTPNPDVQWETDKKLDIGLELGFLKDRIMFTGDFYRNRSGNQLNYLSLPTQTGFNAYTANVPAVIQNTGLEITLNTKNITARNFQWTTSFNITFPKNKLLSYPGLAKSFYGNTYVIGQPITLTRLFHYTGVDPKTGEPEYATKSGSGLPNYTTDRIIAPIGTPYYGGIGNSFTYKNWSFSFFVQFTHQKGFTNNTYYSPIGASMANMNTSVLNRWRQPGDVGTLFPGASATPGSPVYNAYGYYYGSSDAFWGDASWLKIRNASLSYSFASRFAKHLGLSTLRLYTEGQNLLLLDKNKYQFDPETNVPGGPPGLGTGQFPAVPPLRTIVFGINVSF